MSNLWKAPKLPQRAMLHAKAIYNEHFVIVKDRTIPNRRTFYLSPVFHDTDDFVRVTFIRPTAANDRSKGVWADAIVSWKNKHYHIDTRPLTLVHPVTGKSHELSYYEARHVYEGWHHELPEADIFYICNPRPKTSD